MDEFPEIGDTVVWRGRKRIVRDTMHPYVKMKGLGCWYNYSETEGFRIKKRIET